MHSTSSQVGGRRRWSRWRRTSPTLWWRPRSPTRCWGCRSGRLPDAEHRPTPCSGYHGEYEWLGKVPARLDDLVNLLPARLAGHLLASLAGLVGGRPAAVRALMRRDAHRTPSPNGGWPMAAMAGSLGRRLEKPGVYALADELPDPSRSDIRGPASVSLVRRHRDAGPSPLALGASAVDDSTSRTQSRPTGAAGGELEALGIDPASVHDFSVCINPYGRPKRAERSGTAGKRIPDTDTVALRRELARRWGCAPEDVVCGNARGAYLVQRRRLHPRRRHRAGGRSHLRRVRRAARPWAPPSASSGRCRSGRGALLAEIGALGRRPSSWQSNNPTGALWTPSAAPHRRGMPDRPAGLDEAYLRFGRVRAASSLTVRERGRASLDTKDYGMPVGGWASVWERPRNLVVASGPAGQERKRIGAGRGTGRAAGRDFLRRTMQTSGGFASAAVPSWRGFSMPVAGRTTSWSSGRRRSASRDASSAR